MRRAAILGLAVALPLAGCADGTNPNQNALTLGALGAVGGGAIGAAVTPGNRVLGGVIGAAGGGLIGGLVGRQLDIDSERRRQEAMQRAAATPMQQTEWVGKDAGTRGSVRFRERPSRASDGQTCATVQETILIGGQAQQADRQTCRRPDGTWT